MMLNDISTGMLGRHRFQSKKLHNAIVVIQCAVRSFVARRKVIRRRKLRKQAQAKAAKKKKAKFNNNQASNRFMELKRELAAIKIQRIQRGIAGRARFWKKKQYWAAQQLQKIVRSKLGRARVQRIKISRVVDSDSATSRGSFMGALLNPLSSFTSSELFLY